MPANHADVVRSRRALFLREHSIFAQDEFGSTEEFTWHRTTDIGDVSTPVKNQGLFEKTEEVENVSRADRTSHGALLLQSTRLRIRLKEARLFFTVRAEHAELFGLASRRLQILLVHVNLQPLTRHGGGHETKRHLLLADADADLNFIHSSREQRRRLAADEVGELILQRRDSNGEVLFFEMRQEVDVNSGRRSTLGSAVHQRQRQRLDGLVKNTLQSAFHDILGMRETAQQQVLCWTAPSTDRRLTDVHVKITVHSRETSQAIVLETSEFEKVSDSGSFTAVQ